MLGQALQALRQVTGEYPPTTCECCGELSEYWSECYACGNPVCLDCEREAEVDYETVIICADCGRVVLMEIQTAVDKAEYPEPCARCGMCCLSQPCLIGKAAGSPAGRACIFLDWSGSLAACHLYQVAADAGLPRDHLDRIYGIGSGCCISARAISSTTGVEVDFAGLPPRMKRALAARASIRR